MTTTVKISRHWDANAEVLTHHRNAWCVSENMDPRSATLGGHSTEIVHHGYGTDPVIVGLMESDAGPDVVVDAIRSLHATAQASARAAELAAIPAPPAVAAILSHGREVRQLAGGGYEVQPPNDNYWRKFSSLAAAIEFGERGNSMS